MIKNKYTVNGYPKREFTLLGLLDEFISKAGVSHTQDKAQACWKVLSPILYEIDTFQTNLLNTAWSHHIICWEGPEELWEEGKKMKEIINFYLEKPAFVTGGW